MTSTSSAPDGGPAKRLRGDGLLELGADLRQVRTQLATTSQNLREVAGVVAEIAPQVADHAEQLARLRGEVDALLQAPEETPVSPVEWPALSAEDAYQHWQDLAEWIDSVLVPWYGITRGQLPDCWPRHRRAVVELSWLRSCYLQAYLPSSSPTQAAEWHTRWLPAALESISRAIPATMCRPGEHLVPGTQSALRRQHPVASPGQPQSPVQPYSWQASPPPASAPTVELLESQQATREHWGEHWAQAVREDLATRQQRQVQAGHTTAET